MEDRYKAGMTSALRRDQIEPHSDSTRKRTERSSAPSVSMPRGPPRHVFLPSLPPSLPWHENCTVKRMRSSSSTDPHRARMADPPMTDDDARMPVVSVCLALAHSLGLRRREDVTYSRRRQMPSHLWPLSPPPTCAITLGDGEGLILLAAVVALN